MCVCVCVVTDRTKIKRETERKRLVTYIDTYFHINVQFAKSHHVFTIYTFTVADIIIITI